MANKGDVVISVPTGDGSWFSTVGFHKYAAEYLEAGKLFVQSREKSFGYTPVPYFLYSKSIELSLKAYLLSKKFPKKELGSRGINHDLEKALSEAKLMQIEKLIAFTLKDEETIKKANSYYKSKGFEYCEKAEIISKAMNGYPDLPDLNCLENLATKLVINLEEHCFNS